MPVPVVDEDNHPEALVLQPYCVGKGIDVGCGHRKVSDTCIGVDLMAPGEVGRFGVTQGQVCVADVQASGDDLPMFADGSLDFVVARHNLEHYIDVVATLIEWRRVLRSGGRLAVVLPDEEVGDTVYLDPTHKHAFTQDSSRNLLQAIGGFDNIETAVVVEKWSFLITATRV